MLNIEDITVTNGACLAKTPLGALELCSSAVTRGTLGSFTLLPRTGNLGETYYYDPRTKLMAAGLP